MDVCASGPDVAVVTYLNMGSQELVCFICLWAWSIADIDDGIGSDCTAAIKTERSLFCNDCSIGGEKYSVSLQ